MFVSWRSLGGQQRILSKLMPRLHGDVVERASELAHLVVQADSTGGGTAQEMANLIQVARDVARNINDLGVLVEHGIVRQRDFFRNYHQRIIELAYLLEPLALLISVSSGNRWGFRLNRLRIAAERYHYQSEIDAHRTLNVDGTVVLIGRPRPLPRVNRYLPHRRSFIPRSTETRRRDEAVMSALDVKLFTGAQLTKERLRQLLN
jgi:hypothetical protein